MLAVQSTNLKKCAQRMSKIEHCHLLLDRTDWQFGKRKINLLVIGLLYKDVFIPLVWKDLEKKSTNY